MNALEHGRRDDAVHHARPLVRQHDVLRADDHVHLFVFLEVVHAVEHFVEEPHLARARNGAGKDVALPDEIRDEGVRGLVVNIRRRPYLLDHAVLHDHDRVAHRQRLFLVVRDVDKGDAQLSVHFLEFELHLLSHLQVERAERLVEKKNLRFVDDGAGDRDALLLPARKGGYAAFFKPLEVDDLERALHLLRDLPLGELLHAVKTPAVPVFISDFDAL